MCWGGGGGDCKGGHHLGEAHLAEDTPDPNNHGRGRTEAFPTAGASAASSRMLASLLITVPTLSNPLSSQSSRGPSHHFWLKTLRGNVTATATPTTPQACTKETRDPEAGLPGLSPRATVVPRTLRPRRDQKCSPPPTSDPRAPEGARAGRLQAGVRLGGHPSPLPESCLGSPARPRPGGSRHRSQKSGFLIGPRPGPPEGGVGGGGTSGFAPKSRS